MTVSRHRYGEYDTSYLAAGGMDGWSELVSFSLKECACARELAAACAIARFRPQAFSLVIPLLVNYINY